MALLEKHLFVQESTIPGAGKGLFTKVEIPKETQGSGIQRKTHNMERSKE